MFSKFHTLFYSEITRSIPNAFVKQYIQDSIADLDKTLKARVADYHILCSKLAKGAKFQLNLTMNETNPAIPFQHATIFLDKVTSNMVETECNTDDLAYLYLYLIFIGTVVYRCEFKNPIPYQISASIRNQFSTIVNSSA